MKKILLSIIAFLITTNSLFAQYNSPMFFIDYGATLSFLTNAKVNPRIDKNFDMEYILDIVNKNNQYKNAIGIGLNLLKKNWGCDPVNIPNYPSKFNDYAYFKSHFIEIPLTYYRVFELDKYNSFRYNIGLYFAYGYKGRYKEGGGNIFKDKILKNKDYGIKMGVHYFTSYDCKFSLTFEHGFNNVFQDNTKKGYICSIMFTIGYNLLEIPMW